MLVLKFLTCKSRGRAWVAVSEFDLEIIGNAYWNDYSQMICNTAAKSNELDRARSVRS